MSRSNNSSVERVSASDVPLHRFVDFAIDLKTKNKQLKVLNPSLSQVSKNTSQQPFGTEKRKTPFPVKEEHSSVCQHQRIGSTLGSNLVSFPLIFNRLYLSLQGTIPREKREASLETSKHR